jgi:hypothetical protein
MFGRVKVPETTCQALRVAGCSCEWVIRGEIAVETIRPAEHVEELGTHLKKAGSLTRKLPPMLICLSEAPGGLRFGQPVK